MQAPATGLEPLLKPGGQITHTSELEHRAALIQHGSRHVIEPADEGSCGRFIGAIGRRSPEWPLRAPTPLIRFLRRPKEQQIAYVLQMVINPVAIR